MQSFTVPCSGTYKLEVWGAQGENAEPLPGGKGGSANGNKNFNRGSILYIVVGAKGYDFNGSSHAVSYNGCGTGSKNNGGGGGSGYIGGVTDGSMQNSVREGNGYARITLVTVE